MIEELSNFIMWRIPVLVPHLVTALDFACLIVLEIRTRVKTICFITTKFVSSLNNKILSSEVQSTSTFVLTFKGLAEGHSDKGTQMGRAKPGKQ
jgi:hypothetical protein